MNHAVGLHDVRDGDCSLATFCFHQPQFAVVQHDGQRFALNGFQHHFATVHFRVIHQLLGGVGAGDDVAGQDLRQVCLVFRVDQRIDSPGGQLGEGLIVGGEDGKGAFAVERINQSGSLDRGNERRVILGVDGVFDAGFRRIHGGATDHDGVGGETESSAKAQHCEQVRAMRLMNVCMMHLLNSSTLRVRVMNLRSRGGNGCSVGGF